MNRFTILILLFSSFTFGQETTSHLRPGIQISSVFSSNDDYGISPALTLTSRRWMILAGPRFAYDRMFREKSTFFNRNTQLIIDASFRYYLMSEEKTARLFVQAGTEYKYWRTAYDEEYITGQMLAYGPALDYNFPGNWDRKEHYLSIYTGLGVDITIWKQLSVFASFGAGTYFSRAKSVVTNTNSGRVEYSTGSYQNWRFVWVASAGLGYRF